MRKAAILFNPASGDQHRNMDVVNAATEMLRAAGIGARLIPTHGPGSATVQTHEAIAEGCDVVFAAGGDGTMHEVLQALAPAHAPIPLGLIPLGTGNVLAAALGLPKDPVEAVCRQINFEPRRISAGRVECASERTGSGVVRYFTLMCGVGLDAEMLRMTLGEPKRMLGQYSYYWNALRLMARFKLPTFTAEPPTTAAEADAFSARTVTVSQACACRVADFRMAGRIAPGAALSRDDFEVVLYKGGSPMTYFKESLHSVFGLNVHSKNIERIHGKELVCRDSYSVETAADAKHPEHPIRVEADGEVIGTLPVRVSIHPYAFSLLMPKN